MSKFRVERLSNSQFKLWDDYVQQHPYGTIFHTSKWLRRIKDDVIANVVLDGNDKIQGGVALIETKKYGVRGFHIPPYTPYYGPLISESNKKSRSSARSEEQQIITLILNNLSPAMHYDFTFPILQNDIIPFIVKGFSSSIHYTHEIKGKIDDYYSNIAKRKMKLLKDLYKMADKSLLKIIKSADIRDISMLVQATAERGKYNPRYGLLEKLFSLDNIQDDLFWSIFIVKDENEKALSCVLLAFDNKRAYNLINGSLQKGGAIIRQTNYLCMDYAIKYTLKKNLVFDFEGSILPGVEEFYRRLGGQPVPLFRVQKSRSLPYFIFRMGKQFLLEHRK